MKISLEDYNRIINPELRDPEQEKRRLATLARAEEIRQKKLKKQAVNILESLGVEQSEENIEKVMVRL